MSLARQFTPLKYFLRNETFSLQILLGNWIFWLFWGFLLSRRKETTQLAAHHERLIILRSE
jgi:hypothetical protein